MTAKVSIDALEDAPKKRYDAWEVGRRADDVLLKLLDAIERDLAADKPIGAHVEAYEALSRAEAVRRPTA